MANIGGESVDRRAIHRRPRRIDSTILTQLPRKDKPVFAGRRLSPICHWPPSLAMRAWLRGCEEEKR
jgi:hypothetical protein